MEIIAVDDEQLSLDGLIAALSKVNIDANVMGFKKASAALEYAYKHKIDVAFLDIQMRGVNGMELAADLKKLHPYINVIFTTGFSEYAGEALSMHASGYIMKPITAEKIKKELADLRYKGGQEVSKKKFKIVTFGNFAVFDGENPVKFKYRKSYEVLAYLVDRHGSFASNGELIAALWEDDGDYEGRISYLNNIRADIKNTLAALGYGDIILRQRGHLAIDVNEVDCDYFRYIGGDKEALKSYHGEYMSQYSWAELTNASLMNETGLL
ncbi:MAG: response regulator [Lachnospiraceae bacterium]|nr:response regulator [Lachnospiraceae bacterium]